MKKIISVLSVLLALCLLAGCVGTPVVYHSDCDCPTEGVQNNPSTDITPPEGELKTGLAILTDISGSTSASSDKNGEAKYDVTMVAVLVDANGVIRDCIIDGISSSVKFDGTGAITTDLSADVKTKNELGKDYGMVAYGGAKYEWNEQAAALAKFAVGKTVKELKEGAVDETGKAPAGSDLASSATIYLGGYVSAIEKAVSLAQVLGAKDGDTLKMATVASISGSKNATAEKDGTAQLDATVTALTLNDGVITSCNIDSIQAKISFDAAGANKTDPTATVKTKNELGKDYGMVAYGGAKYEWNEQAAAFAKYVTGKTAAEVAGIAVSETTVPTEVDLASSVTIAIGDFMALIQKAAK